MRCALRGLFGFPAACEEGLCVFWRDDTGPNDEFAGPGCVLEEFELTGTVADRLARWLLAYKHAADRAQVTAARNTHSQCLASRIEQRSPDGRHSPRGRQKSPSCPACRSVVT